MRIKDIVHIDKMAGFRNDVRLTSFYEPVTNRSLLESYLFSSQAPTGMVASLEMLRITLERFLNPNLENRLLLIANYGHGKSHLALVMANYFAREPESKEFGIIEQKIRNAALDPATAQRFIDFKNAYPRHLVLILSGDRPVPLRQAFLQAVDEALKHHPQTRSIQIPFWYEKAREWLLEKVLPDNALKKKAERFLGEHHKMDLKQLQVQLEERNSNMYEVCRSLFKHLTGVLPDFGAEIALADILDWLVKECCSEEGPFKGLLILFDEFSLFLDRYYQSSAAGDLQDLLNGVDKHRGNVVFLALAQHDPNSLLDSRARSRLSDPNKIEEVRKELTRIPSSSRKVLHTLMESVLDSYLDQDTQHWEHINKQCSRSIDEASEITYKLFRERYQDNLKWDKNKMTEVLTKGCFPLHPLTTALLCNMPLHTKSGSNPRTVLGFVNESVNAIAEEPAISHNGKLNWILPITLVDEFGEMFNDDLYRAYQNTLRQIGTEAPEVWKQVIKAMLLYDVQQLNPREVPYERALAHMTGLEEVQVQIALRELHQKNYIQYDSSRKVYRFWSGTADIQKLEDLIQRKQKSTLEWTDWRKLVDELRDKFPSIEPDIVWGASSDWAPKVFIMLREFCTETNLKQLHTTYHIDSNRGKLVEGDRGLLLLLLTHGEEDKNWYRDEMPNLLQKVYGQDEAVPALALILPETITELVDHWTRLEALRSFDRSDIERIGDRSVYQSEVSRLEKLIGEKSLEIGNFINQPHPASSFLAPLLLRGVLNQYSRLTVRKAITEVYKSKYRACPPFYTQYPTRGARGSNNNFNKAVVQVARLLLKNGANIVPSLNNKMISDLCLKYLIGSWRLLNERYSVRPPDEPTVRKVWDALEQTIPIGGSVRAQDVLIPLLNPPFGCDPSVLLLIASAWIGYHRHDLEFETSGRVQALDTLIEEIFKDCHRPSEVLLRLCYRENVGIKRLDRAARQKECEKLIYQAEQSSPQSCLEAQTRIARLQQVINDPSLQDSLKEQAKKQIERWSQALDLARAYDKRVSELLQATNLNDLLKSFADLAHLPKYTIVLPDQPKPAEVRTTLLERLKEQVDEHCRRFEQLSALEGAEHHRNQLNLLAKRLKQLRCDTSRVEQAEQTLERNIEKLKQRQSESAYRTRIESMSLNAPLHELRRYLKEIEQMPDGSDEFNGLRAKTQEQIRTKIHELETQLQQWQQKADELTRLQDAQALRDAILTEQRLYESAPEAQAVHALLQRTEQIRDFLNQLDQAEKSPLSERLERLQSLQHDSQSLSDALKNILKEKITHTQNLIREKETEAIGWLRQQQKLAEQRNCDWFKLQRDLETPPQFLPEAAQNELDLLREQVKQRILEDTIQHIKAEFLKLDTERKRRLLDELQQLVEGA